MLMIFLMAILSLDLIHYSSQNRNSGNTHPESRGYGFHTIPENHPLNVTTSTTKVLRSTTPLPKKPKKRIIVKKRKLNQNDTQPAASHKYSAKKRPISKSDMQVLQFYAQPVTTFDVSYHPPIYENYNPMTNGILNMNDQPLVTDYVGVPTAEPIPYKSLPEFNHFVPDYKSQPVSWNLASSDRQKQIPIYDPFNIMKRKPVRFHGNRPLPGQKFLPTIRPITPMTTLPPITVTHIFKYEESNSGLKLPFETHEDSFVENFPALSMALDEHLNERVSDVTHIGLKNYMTPPKLNQPIYYNMPVVELPPLTPIYQNEFDILHKFNEAINTQTQNAQPQHQTEQNEGFEYEENSKETQEETNYSDNDVKKALEYIQTLKKNKKPDRGSKKFNSERIENKSRNKKGKKNNDESHEEEEEEQPVEERKKKRKKPKNNSFEDDENFKIKSFEELDEEESHKKVVKTPKKKVRGEFKKPKVDDPPDLIRYQESQIVPSMDNEQPLSPPDFSQNADLGGESNEDRVEFQMHGLQGPESYKFGYDTGKGENRQFRYEERDPEGKVKGHFGYYDKDGKLQVFNYEADPEHGYHLEQAHQ